MRKLCLYVVLCTLTVFAIPSPYFHFDFEKASDCTQKKVLDATGRVHLNSQLSLFKVQENALRISNSAIFYIENNELPDMTAAFTLSAWVKTSVRGLEQPIFVKGYKSSGVQFYFYTHHLWLLGQYLCNAYPRGVFLLGSGYDSRYVLESMKYVTSNPPVEFMPGKWCLLTWVFDHGNLAIYLDEKKLINYTTDTALTMKNNGQPLFIGCLRDTPQTVRNNLSGDMRINNIRLWTSALTQGNISEIFNQEYGRYVNRPSHNSFDPGLTWPCHDYTTKVLPDYDPTYERVLKITQEHLKTRRIQSINGKSESRIVSKNRVSHIEIDGKEYYPLQAAANAGNFRCDSANPANKVTELFQDLSAQNFDLTSIMCSSWYDVPIFWKGYKKYDFSIIDTLVKKVLAGAPNSRLQFAIHPEMNTWFQEKHSDCLEISLAQWSSKGARIKAYTGNPGSDIWIQVTNDMLYELVKYLESQPYAKQIYDYKLFMSGGGEWHWPMCFTGAVGGYSQATQQSFRNWLKDKYGTDDKLQKAWNNPKITLHTAQVPTPEERKEAEHFLFRDPETSVSSHDFQCFLHDRTFKELKENTEAIKRGCNYKKTVTIYYGYGFYFMGDVTKLQSGCSALGRVLELDSVDNIGTPICYRTRGLGKAGMNVNPFASSINAHGKLLWQENDLRTHLNPSPVGYGQTSSEKQDIQQLRRGFAQSVASACGFWYFPGYQFHSEGLVGEFKSWTDITPTLLKGSRASVAQAAMIFDEASMFDLSSYGAQFLRGHSRDFLNESFHAGAPMDCWLLSDLDKMPEYKVYFFINTYRTTPTLRAKIRTRLASNHAIAVWCYAPGLIGDSPYFDTAAMKELTGMDFTLRMVQIEDKLAIKPGKVSHPLMRYGVNPTAYKVGPLVVASDPEAEVLAKCGISPAYALKKNSDFTSIWTLMPLERHGIAAIYDYAGIHRYQNEGYDVVNANENFLMIHATSAGKKTLHLPAPSRVTELFSDKFLGDKLTTITDTMEFGDTRLYMIQSVK